MIQFSFIIPVYNCKPYLSECVEGICNAGAQCYEVLLIDDGSVDGSGELCDTLAAAYPEVRVIHQKNSGASAARNRGIREAQGEKVLFFDADDSIDSVALGRILADPRCDQTDLTIFGLTFDYYSKGKCYRRDPLFFKHGGILEEAEWGKAFAELYEKNSLSPVWNKIFKRKILLQYQLELNTDMFLYEDFEFVLRYMQHCGSIWNVPQAVYHYRQSEDEGNAKRRLSRIKSIPVFLKPIEAALNGLIKANLGVPKEQTDQVLQQLYLVLAREKIAVSDLAGVHRVCGEFIKWTENHDLPLEASRFQKRLLRDKALELFLLDKKTVLRHKVAVWVKSHI